MDLLLSPETPHAASDGLQTVVLQAGPRGGQLDGAEVPDDHAHGEDALAGLRHQVGPVPHVRVLLLLAVKVKMMEIGLEEDRVVVKDLGHLLLGEQVGVALGSGGLPIWGEIRV